MLTGENSILKRATGAKEATERAELQEALQLAYIDLVGKDILDNSSSAKLDRAVQAVTNQGYKNITTVQSGGSSSISGISIDGENNISVNKNNITPVTIRVKYEGGSSSGNSYYAEFYGKYYRINETDKGIEIENTPSPIENSSSGETLTATSQNNNVVKDNKIVPSENNSFIITPESVAGSSEITFTYKKGTTEYTTTCTVSVIVTPTETDIANANSNTTLFSTDYGKIDVIWLSGTGNTYSATPNAPELGGMTPVSWTKSGDTWTEDATAQSSYYSYTAGSGTVDNTSSQWANAKNSDGSYFVWIPRYAYRIIYYDKDYRTDSTAKITGYYDGYGMWKADDGSVKYTLSREDSTIETVDYGGNKYIVHPAFCDGTRDGYDNGQWSSPLKGFWVAKYEMSRNGATDSSAGSGYSGIAFKSVPNVQSAREIAIGDMYTVSKSYDSTKESHMMKNSEWGAVAYLTHSQYGRNGNEIDINNSSTYITGNGGGSTSESYNSGTTNAYNTTTGAKASTTGNVYGIYDMSGGANEYVAIFNNTDTYGCEASNGSSFATTTNSSNAYATKYLNTTRSYYGNSVIYVYGKVGDATKEVNKGGNYAETNTRQYNNWFGDRLYLCWSDNPFFARGGSYFSGSTAGVFFSDYGEGGVSYSYYGFRVVLCP